jgi:hypothetical protein
VQRIGWAPPEASNPVRKRNYRAIRLDSAAMGAISAASIFMPVFIVRLGGTNLEVSLLTALPALAGFLLAIPIGTFLQSRRNVVPWYSRSRGFAQLVYAATAIAVAIVPSTLSVPVVLLLWGVVTIPSAIGTVAFNVFIDGAAGPRGRYDLLSMRWSIMGLTTAITVAIVGQVLEVFGFPLNYQLVFFGFSAAGVLSYYFSSQVQVPDHARPPGNAGAGLRQRGRSYLGLFRNERPFLTFVGRHFVLTFGYRLAAPLIPLWYVREAHAPDSWIGVIGMGQSLALLVGYAFWRRQSRRSTTRLLVLASTAGLAFYPGLLSVSTNLVAVAAITAVGALFSSGVDLVLFDQLMKTIPSRFGITFSAVETSSQNLATIIAPLLGGLIADAAGIGAGLILASVVTMVGALMLTLIPPRGEVAVTAPPPTSPPTAPPDHPTVEPAAGA